MFCTYCNANYEGNDCPIHPAVWMAFKDGETLRGGKVINKRLVGDDIHYLVKPQTGFFKWISGLTLISWFTDETTLNYYLGIGTEDNPHHGTRSQA